MGKIPNRRMLDYGRLTVNESMAGLPVTDLHHVCEEINLWRRTLLALDYRRRYNRQMTNRWREKQKNKNK